MALDAQLSGKVTGADGETGRVRWAAVGDGVDDVANPGGGGGSAPQPPVKGHDRFIRPNPDWLPSPLAPGTLPPVFPTLPCRDSRREGLCTVWAQRMCASRSGSWHSKECYDRCVETAVDCCMGGGKGSCNDPGREAVCVGRAVRELQECNSENVNEHCLDVCYEDFLSRGYCDHVCSGCYVSIGSLMDEIIACALGPVMERDWREPLDWRKEIKRIKPATFYACLKMLLAYKGITCSGCAGCWASTLV